MSSIKLEDIIQATAAENWKVLSTEYINLDTVMTFECPQGHQVLAPWKKIRNKLECPLCKKNIQLNNSMIVPKSKGVRRILALDQASHITGYAIFDDDQLIKYGTFRTDQSEEIARCATIKAWLDQMIDLWRIDYVALEGIQFQDESSGQRMGITVFQTLARLQGILMETCYKAKIEFEICPTNTWRHALAVKGKTRADRKRSTQLIIKEIYHINCSEDEADAIGIGRYLSSRVIKNTEIQNWET